MSDYFFKEVVDDISVLQEIVCRVGGEDSSYDFLLDPGEYYLHTLYDTHSRLQIAVFVHKNSDDLSFRIVETGKPLAKAHFLRELTVEDCFDESRSFLRDIHVFDVSHELLKRGEIVAAEVFKQFRKEYSKRIKR